MPPAPPVLAELQRAGGGRPGPIRVRPGEAGTDCLLVVDCEEITYDMDPDAVWDTIVTVAISL